MLQVTRDIRMVALWPGHAALQSTEIYLRADPAEKFEMFGALALPVSSRENSAHRQVARDARIEIALGMRSR
jgi:hypothetical protein